MANSVDNIKKYAINWFSFDETSGNTLDGKGSVIGTVTSATRVSGWNSQGNAMNFDGVDDYVTFNGKVFPVGAMSIRFKFKSTSASQGRIMGTTDGGDAGIIIGYYGHFAAKNFGIHFNNGTAGATIQVPTTIGDGAWHDILITWNGTTAAGGLKVYVDDMIIPALTASAPYTVPSHSFNLRLGADPNSTLLLKLAAQLDELEIYNKVISAIPDKTLIKSAGTYKYHNGTSWVDVNTAPSEADFIQYGMNDISSITQAQWTELSAPTIATWSDFVDKVVTVETETEPFSIYDEMGDSMEVIYYTDDTSKTAANLEITANHSPLDELDGTVEFVTWTNAELKPGDENVLSYTGIPLGQFTKLASNVSLKGNLTKFTTSETAASNKGISRYLLSGDGVTWKTYQNGTWTTVDTTNKDIIIQKGMTATELNALSEMEISQLSTTAFNIGIFLDEDTRKIQETAIESVEYNEISPSLTAQVNDAKLYILNTTSTINVTFAGKTVSGVINDEDQGKVQYRVLLNDIPYFPVSGEFTTLQPSPLNVGITLDSTKIVPDAMNTLRIEFQDAWGQTDYWEDEFIGTYYGLIFSDGAGGASSYYSTDLGLILKNLDFGTIIAGQTTVEHKVVLKNTYGYTVENVKLSVNEEVLPAGMSVQFGTNLISFEALPELVFEGQMNDGEQKDFYLRLATILGTTPSASGQFDIIVTADKSTS